MSVEEYLRKQSTQRLEAILQHVLQFRDVYDPAAVVLMILDILSEREDAPRYQLDRSTIRKAEIFRLEHSELFKECEDDGEGQ